MSDEVVSKSDELEFRISQLQSQLKAMLKRLDFLKSKEATKCQK
jgi:chaperonin cofactor prefoldin